MQRRFIHLMIVSVWLLSLAGCQGFPGRVPASLELVGEYTYRDGQAVFTVLPGYSSPLVVYKRQQPDVIPPEVTLQFTDVSIDTTPSAGARDLLLFDGPLAPAFVTKWQQNRVRLPDVYEINSVTAQEFVEGKWEAYSEFHPSNPPTVTTRIGIALVLDTSDSIDMQRALAKGVATSMMRRLKQRWPANAWISVVPLGAGGKYHDFSQDKAAIEVNLAAVSDVRYTALYDAVGTAYDSFATFERSQSANGDFHFDKKWILVFTDGQDDYSGRFTLDSLKSYLAAGDVSIYAFGVEALDELDRDALEPLAGERFAEVSGMPFEQRTLREKAAIDLIASQTPLYYAVSYERNDQAITAPRRIKLIFEVEKLGH